MPKKNAAILLFCLSLFLLSGFGCSRPGKIQVYTIPAEPLIDLPDESGIPMETGGTMETGEMSDMGTLPPGHPENNGTKGKMDSRLRGNDRMGGNDGMSGNDRMGGNNGISGDDGMRRNDGMGGDDRGLNWTLPAHWKALPASGMRVAAFEIPIPNESPLTLTVVKLGGPAGGVLANINRWRNQLGLAPISPSDVSKSLTKMETAAGMELAITDIQNPQGEHILAAITSAQGETWFFKVQGTETKIEGVKSQIILFLKSIRPK